MNSTTLTQLQIFADDILLPAFVDLKQLLENSEAKVFIANNASTGSNEIDIMLQQMHLGKPSLAKLLNSSFLLQELPANTQNWVGDSLCVERIQNIETVSAFIGFYCFSIEFIVTPSAEIHATYTVGTMLSGQEQPHIHIYPSKDNFQPSDILNIKTNDIVLRVIKGFEDFEATLFAYKATLAESPEIEKAELNQASYTNSFNYSELTSLPLAEVSEIYLSSSTKPEFFLPTTEQFTDPQTLYDLSKQLTQTLAPQGFPIHSKLNPKLQSSAEIKPIQDRYQRTIDLSLEYSPAITEAELTEYLYRLGHYQTLKHFAHLHIFVQEQMQAWHKQNGQPSLGAIAPHIQKYILKLRDHLYERIQTLAETQLKSTAQVLKHEVDTLTLQQQNQQTLLDQLDQNPLLGYLDVSLLDINILPEQPIEPFTDSSQPIHITAQHLKSKTNRLTLSHIASCDSEKYKAYCHRKPDRPDLKRFIEYTITQKLYPQRPVFMGTAPKPVYPRLELLWGETDNPTLNPNPLTQIWCVYPMMRTAPPQWLVIAATRDTHPLQNIALENGQIAQEGSYEYLSRALGLMRQCKDEYTRELSDFVREALEGKRLRYLHIHQTQDSQTKEPRDILQMQFQLLG